MPKEVFSASSPWSWERWHCIVYVHFQAHFSIGLKRNMGLHLANGNFVVHFDDDDLYAPQYIEWVVNNMVKRDLRVLTLSSWYNCNLHDGTFPDLSLSEDYMFMCRLQANLGREKVGLFRDRLGMCMRTRFKKSCRDMYKRTRFKKCRRDMYKSTKFKKFHHAVYKRTRFKKSRRNM